MLLLLALLAGHGVDEPPAGHTLLRDEAGEVRGAWTSYGLLDASADALLWTPEEAVPAEFIWDAHLVGDDFLVATSTGVFRSRTGCDWQKELPGIVVRFAPTSTRLYAAVQNLGAAGGLAFLELSSPSSTWQQSVHWRAGLLIEAIEIEGDTLWVSGFDGAEFFIARINGDDWSNIATSATRRVLLAVDNTGVWVAASRETQRLDRQGAALFSLAQRFVGARTLSGRAGNPTEFLNESGERFVYDEMLQGLSPGAVRLDGDTVAFDVTQSQAHFQSRGEDLLDFANVTPRRCEPDSAAFDVSNQAWPILQAQGVGPRKAVETPPDNGGCNNSRDCGWAVLLLLGWCGVRRKKAQDAPTATSR